MLRNRAVVPRKLWKRVLPAPQTSWRGGVSAAALPSEASHKAKGLVLCTMAPAGFWFKPVENMECKPLVVLEMAVVDLRGMYASIWV